MWPSQLEWKIAKQHLKINTGHPDKNCTKIKRGIFQDKETQETVPLKHSFIIFFSTIIAIGTHDNYIQNSKNKSVARIKLGVDENGNVYALKIILSNPLLLTKTLQENTIATDLSVAINGGYRQHTKTDQLKCYAPYFYYKGGTLDNYLKTHQAGMNVHEIYKLAFDTTLAVHILHTGESANTGTPYAHLDIKPSNFVMNEFNEPELIDFGFATKNPNSIIRNFRGTPGYLIINPIGRRKETLDIHALMRTLFLPEYFETQSSRNPEHPIQKDRRRRDDRWIFPDHMVKSNPQLLAFLSKINNDTEITNLSAFDILIELTLLHIDLDNSYRPLLQSKLAIMLTNMLFTQHIPIKKEYLHPEVMRVANLWETFSEKKLDALVAQTQSTLVNATFIESFATIPEETADESNDNSATTSAIYVQANHYHEFCFFKPNIPCARFDFYPSQKLMS